MDHLWSPWRMEYIRRRRSSKGCIFCDVVKRKDEKESLIVKHGKQAYVIMNRFPYTSGHIMVVPYRHVDTFDKLEAETCAEAMELLREGIQAINQVYSPDGYNMGANLGAVAGAGIADHIHFHLVPRWEGDTNFMSSIGATRVLPEDLCETWQRLKDAWPTADNRK